MVYTHYLNIEVTWHVDGSLIGPLALRRHDGGEKCEYVQMKGGTLGNVYRKQYKVLTPVRNPTLHVQMKGSVRMSGRVFVVWIV